MKKFVLVSLLAMLGACADVEDLDDPHNDSEVITTVLLTFAPTDGGEELSFAWADPDNTGDPEIDEVLLEDGVAYALSVQFLNELEDPAEDLTEEIEDESDQHQVFFTGSGVEGPATGDNADAVLSHDYDDEDANGLPVGLENLATALAVGSGELTVTLRHLPPENGEDVKVEGLAEQVATDGFSSIGGDDDALVTFEVTVE